MSQRRRIPGRLAKLTAPRLHRAIVRDRLLEYLDQARASCPVMSVIGPPGAGKSTLVASWVATRHLKNIWYQLDPGDADLPTFFYYLGQAVSAFSLRKSAMPVLTPEHLGDSAGFARRFFRELYARLEPGSVLVLDNYQEVGDAHGFHEALEKASL